MSHNPHLAAPVVPPDPLPAPPLSPSARKAHRDSEHTKAKEAGEKANDHAPQGGGHGNNP